jgi:hypothetical protein
MNMSGEIRVKTDQKYRHIYNELKNFAVGDMHELFFICVCLGFRAKKKKALGTTGNDRFWSRTITPEEFTCYYAIMLKENEMVLSVIKDDKFIIEEMEKYANAGMEILLEEFLSDYLIKSGDDLRIDSTSSRELPKALLHFIYEQSQES